MTTAPHALAFLALLATALAAPMARAADAAQPVVIELFQSQGCSSCPPANANVNALSGRPGVLALSFGVTYWDNLGWKDTFASRQFTDRQWAYARALGHSNVGTPQVVINGRRDVVGIDRPGLEAAVATATRAPGPSLSLRADSVAIGAGKAPSRPADVWLVRFDPRVRQVPVRRGENGGKTLPHRNIVVAMQRLGAWSGEPATYRLPPSSDPALGTAILVQSAAAGPILAAARS